MKIFTVLYIFNATLLSLHEIESAYEKEWDLLKLPGGISGFLLLHIPILLVLFYGLIEIERTSTAGLILGLVFGLGGILPFLVHKVFVKSQHHFNRLVSNVVIYLNLVCGIFLVWASASHFLD